MLKQLLALVGVGGPSQHDVEPAMAKVQPAGPPVIYPHARTELKRVPYQAPGGNTGFAFSLNTSFGDLPIEIPDRTGKVIVNAEAVENVLRRIGKVYPPDWSEPDDTLVRMALEAKARGLYTVSHWDVENEKSRRRDAMARQVGFTGLLLQVFEHRDSESVRYNPSGLPGCHLVACGDTGTVATSLFVVEYGHCVHTVFEESSVDECKHVIFAYGHMCQSLNGFTTTRSGQVVDNSLTERGMSETIAGRAFSKYLEMYATAAGK